MTKATKPVSELPISKKKMPKGTTTVTPKIKKAPLLKTAKKPAMTKKPINSESTINPEPTNNTESTTNPESTNNPLIKNRIPCAKVALRQNFHRYGSPCKKSAVRELTRLLTRDINQILVMSLSLAATSKRKVLQKSHVLIAHRHYMNRHRFLPSSA